MKWLISLVVFAASAGLAAADEVERQSGFVDVPIARAGECPDNESEAGRAVIAAREAFNTALVEGDIEPIADVLAEDVILMSGTSSDLMLGRDEQVSVWGKDFETDTSLVYRRNPTCTKVSALYPIALEEGEWRGVSQSDPDAWISGDYVAKWRMSDEGWKIEAEVFSTSSCHGALCPEAANE